MNYYQEISLWPDTDINLYFIWQKLYQQIHLALVENKIAENESAIGSAFPEYEADKFSLGTKLRLFSKEELQLVQLGCDKWLNRIKDYIQVSRIKHVPERVTGYTCFKNIKLKGNKEKLARRWAKRKGETLEQAMAHFEEYKEQNSKLPYINMVSQTNGQHFRLFIEKQGQESSKTGLYSCYGLSGTTTVPLF